MKIGSLFDGSGGFPLAASMCGIEPTWAAEVEPYPIAVTTSRFPKMKHLGSVTDVNGAEVEPVDVVTFGSPCQDLSVAGKRAGLKHTDNGDEETTRSGLFMEAVRIIKEMREATNGVYPRFAVWENVPGAFSSNKGEDFRIVLEELIKIIEPTAVMPAVPKNGWPYADSYCGDGWSLAYRVFDAQFWGVPQRRRRIYLVADFRGQCAGEVSFKREGVRGYFETGRTSWKEAAGDAESGIGTADQGECVGFDVYNMAVTGDVTKTLTAIKSDADHVPVACYAIDQQGGKGDLFQPIAVATQQGGAEISENGICPTVTAAAGMSGNNQPWIAYPDDLVLDDQGGSQISVRTDGKAPILRAEMHGNVPCVMEAGGFCPEQSAKTRGIGWEEEMAPTLRAGVTPAVVYSVENHPADSRVNIDDSGKVQTLTSRMGTGGGNVPMVMESINCVGVMASSAVNAETTDGDISPCLMARAGTGGNQLPLVALEEPIPIHDQATRFSSKRGDNNDGKGNGPGVGNPGDPMNTLTSGDRHAVVYGVETFHCNVEEEKSPILKARDWKDPHVVCYENPIAIDRAFFNQGQNALYDPQVYEDGTNPTLVARGPNEVAVRYIVRRLTPTECARLQGFPDKWGHPDQKEDFTDEEYRFWLEVRNTHATVIGGKEAKDYTKEQMLAWYNKLHTDSAEYKMWGNGIALPCALYVMQGIADVLKEEE